MPNKSKKEISKNQPINRSRRKLLSLAGATGAGMLLSPLLSKAAPSTIIEAGSNVDTASYIIFQDSGKIYAKNGTTGKIEFNNTDASMVIQSAVDALTNGGKIFIKNGIYARSTLTISSCDDTTNWSIVAGTGTLTNDIVDKKKGTGSLSISGGKTRSSGNGDIIYRYSSSSAIDLAGNNWLEVFVKTSIVNGVIYVTIADNAGNYKTWYRQGLYDYDIWNGWNRAVYPLGNDSPAPDVVNGTLDLGHIKYIDVGYLSYQTNADITFKVDDLRADIGVVNITNDYVHIIGEDGTVFNDLCLDISADSATIENIRFTGDTAFHHINISGNYAKIIGCDASDVGISTVAVFCVQIANNTTVTNIIFEDCVVNNGGRHGFFINRNSGSQNAELKDSMFINCRAIGCGQTEQNSNWIVGFDISEGPDLENVKFINCIARECWESGFHTEDVGIMKEVCFIRCISESNGQKPTPDYGNGFLIHGNTYMRNCIARNNKRYGAAIHNGSDTVISECLFEGNIIKDILLQVNATNSIITGNYAKSISSNRINTIIKNNQGYKTESNVLSDAFAIDSIGIKTIIIVHGLNIKPNVQDCYLTVIQNSAVDDWTYNTLQIISTDSINVMARINISKASATSGATAKLCLKVGNV